MSRERQLRWVGPGGGAGTGLLTAGRARGAEASVSVCRGPERAGLPRACARRSALGARRGGVVLACGETTLRVITRGVTPISNSQSASNDRS
eukprot:scaffold48345_cov58-Phaeocystis_antarctica.AAC.3